MTPATSYTPVLYMTHSLLACLYGQLHLRCASATRCCKSCCTCRCHHTIGRNELKCRLLACTTDVDAFVDCCTGPSWLKAHSSPHLTVAMTCTDCTCMLYVGLSCQQCVLSLGLCIWCAVVYQLLVNLAVGVSFLLSEALCAVVTGFRAPGLLVCA
jgi:hypothetical protein